MGAPQPAEKLGERYAIYAEIAQGGMATVHFARLVGPAGFSRTVAVKRLHAKLVDQPEFVRMFLDEARLAARVRHPNVVATIDVIETDDQICLVMEYVHGESLRRLARRVMQQGGRVPRRIAAAIMVGALHGLHAAHEAKNEQGQPLNIVHRDMSPHNIIVGADGIPRVIDFGIAKARGQLSETAAGEIKGKFAYMAPEQLTAGKVTRAADIYAASIVLWELLTGRRLFESKMDASLLERASVKVRRPSSLVPSLTPALDDIVLRGLSGDPDERFSSARAMARAIEDCIAPASTADVGEWVERMVHDRLQAREAILAEIEGRGDARAPQATLPTVPVAFLAAGTVPRPPSPSDPAADSHTPSSSAVVPASSMVPESRYPPPMGGEALATDEGQALQTELDRTPFIGVGGAAAARPPSARPEPVPGPSAQPARPLPWARVVFALLAVLALGLASMIYEAPSYVKGRVAEAGAREGLSMAVGEVVFRPSAVILTGTHVEPVHLEGVTASVGDVEVALHGLSAGDVLVRGFELKAQGPLGDVMGNLARWGAAQQAPLLFQARSGHLVWDDPFGRGTALEAWDTSVLASAAGKVTVASPSVTVRTARTKLGPWSLRIERAPDGSSLSLSLDPSTPTPGLTVSWGGSQSSATLDIERATLSRLGIPAPALGLLGDVEVAGRSSVLETADGKAQGQISLSLFGVRSEGAAGPADATLTARLSGDSLGSLAFMDGQVSSGSSRALLNGTLQVLDSGAHLDLSVRWPGGRGVLPSTVTLDSRDLGGRP